jgi:hypothetical protein
MLEHQSLLGFVLPGITVRVELKLLMIQSLPLDFIAHQALLLPFLVMLVLGCRMKQRVNVTPAPLATTALDMATPTSLSAQLDSIVLRGLMIHSLVPLAPTAILLALNLLKSAFLVLLAPSVPMEVS